jgi:hypothetical protein
MAFLQKTKLRFSLLIALAFALVLNGCGTSAAPPLTVTVVAPASQVLAGAAVVSITATVDNDSLNRGVTWSMTGTGCSGAACGSLSNPTSSSVNYTPPATPPASNITIKITAASVAQPSISSSAIITVPAIIVSLSPGPTTVVRGNVAQFTASVENDAANKGVAWTVSCSTTSCGTISPSKTASGTPTTFSAPTTLTTSLAMTITATSVTDSTKSGADPFTVVLPLTVPTTSLPHATGGLAYSQLLQAVGGLSPYSWSLGPTSALPTGLALGSDGTISGVPTQGGSFNFVVQVTDSGSPQLTALANLAITVTILPLSVTSTTLPNGILDTAYTQPLQATGGIPPYSWSISSGSLPVWASLTSQGTVSGFPNAAVSSNFTVQVADSETPALTATQPLSLTVTKALGANDAELKGSYAFLFSGFDDVTGLPVAVAGSFTADGVGNLANGVEDVNEPSGPSLNEPFTGTYSIDSENRGAFTLDASGSSKTYVCVIGSITAGVATNGRFIEFDDTNGANGQRGSGILRLQDSTAFSLASFAGAYAFGFAGRDVSGNRSAIVGSITADGAGKVTAGVADQNVAGTATNPSLTGTFSAPSTSNGRGMLILSPSGANTMNLAAYVVSSGELLVLTTDAISTAGLLNGTILAQKSTAFADSSFNAPSVVYDVGYNVSNSQTFSEIGVLMPDGKGSLPMSLDESQGGSPVLYQATNSTYSAVATGRVTVSNWAGDTTSSSRYLYLVDVNKAFLLSAGPEVGFGFVEPQAAAPSGGFANSSLTGTFLSGTLPPEASSLPNASALGTLDGTSKFSETVDSSTTSQLTLGQVTTGTYTIATNGRGTVTSLVTSSAIITVLSLGSFSLILALVCAPRLHRHTLPRPAFALVLVLGAILVTTTGCIFPKPQLIFYVISPTKFVVMNQTSMSLAIFEQ